jgi:NAD(P)-dependent dehydrogenase (short-subunit alcohol dehydrogenase family)
VGILDGKRVIITGGAGGIGNAAAHLFHKEGASVACTFNSDVPSLPTGVLVERCDIGSKASIDQAFDTLAGVLGGLDVLIHAAGVHSSMPAADLTEEEWDRVFKLNGKATMFTNQAAFRHLRARGGSIVNMGSIEGVRGTAGNASYAASRGAVMSWTRSIALEWGQFNIRANSLAPVAYTKLAQKVMDKLGAAARAATESYLRSAVPLGGKMGDPACDIAPVLAFLASDASRFITGQVISADGGFMMLGS